MDLIERFRYIMKLNNLTASAFAESIGVQPSSVSHILSGRNKPSLEFIQKIANAYPKIDVSWLISGNTKRSSSPIEIPAESEPKQKSNELGKNTSIVRDNGREIEKILVFYTNGTFKEYGPI